MGSLVLHFRNGATLVQRMRASQPCDEVVLWDGTHIEHPQGRGGLLEAAIEIWLEEVYTNGFYRPADGEVIVDAGANVGLFSIQIARQNRRCRVIALEPFAENFEYLQANIARALLKNVTCHETALGATFARGHMQAVGSRSLDHVLKVDSSAASETTVVPLAGLFELANAKEIDLLKVDIEGSERGVFAAATPDVLYRFKHIAMEYHDQIVPGTLDLLRSALSPTHELTIRPSHMEGCGILLARRCVAARERSPYMAINS
ncbi:MAG: FkbM family methyltransferase [Candidatus Acidiferrales bacterium]